MDKRIFYDLVQEYGSPLLVMDHQKIKENYFEFKKRLPRVQIYYAVKANSEPEIIKTLFKLGSSFDVASIFEFNLIFEFIKELGPKALQDFIWNRIIYANPVKKVDSLHVLNLYKPLLTYDSIEEMEKIKTHCPDAGLLLRIKVPDEGSVVKFSNKFGIEPELAADLIEKTVKNGIGVEGISFHAGSQCNNPSNFIEALRSVAKIFKELDRRGCVIGETVTTGKPIKIVDIGGGFPVQYKGEDQSFAKLADLIRVELDILFPDKSFALLAEPGRFLVANAGTALSRVLLAKHSTGQPCYHIDDGVYNSYSAIMYDHLEPDLKSLKTGEKTECKIFGPTCDGLDELSENSYIHNTGKVFLPKLTEGDIIYQENMGAYSNASATNFNGFPPVKVVHINTSNNRFQPSEGPLFDKKTGGRGLSDLKMSEKIKFNNNILIIGYGSVSQCTLPVLLDHIDAAKDKITIIDIEDKLLFPLYLRNHEDSMKSLTGCKRKSLVYGISSK